MTNKAQDNFIDTLALRYGSAVVFPLEDGENVPVIAVGRRDDILMGDRWYVYPSGVNRLATPEEFARASERAQEKADS